MKTNLILIICLVPLLVAAEIYAISEITWFVRQPSDLHVLIGIGMFSAWLFINVQLAKFITKIITKSKKK